MPSKQDSLILRAQTSYEKLAACAKTLNTISDQLGETVAELDAALKRLNLGIGSWVSFRAWDEGPNWASHDVGYAKVNGKWGLAIRSRNGNDQYQDDNLIGEWNFNEAPRALRLEAVERIPELLEALVKNVGDFTLNLTDKLKKSQELSAAICAVAKAMEQHPEKAGAVPNAPTLDWRTETLRIPAEIPPKSAELPGSNDNSAVPPAPSITGYVPAPPPISGVNSAVSSISGYVPAPPPISGYLAEPIDVGAIITPGAVSNVTRDLVRRKLAIRKPK